MPSLAGEGDRRLARVRGQVSQQQSNRGAILSIVLRDLDFSLWGREELHFRKSGLATGWRLVGEDKRRVREVS